MRGSENPTISNTNNIEIFESTQVALSAQFLQTFPSTLNKASFFLALADELDLTFCEQIEDGCPVLVGLWNNVRESEEKLKSYLHSWLQGSAEELPTEIRNEEELTNVSSVETQIENKTNEVLAIESSDLVNEYGLFVTNQPRVFVVTNEKEAYARHDISHCATSGSKSGLMDLEQQTRVYHDMKDVTKGESEVNEIFVDIAVNQATMKPSKGKASKKSQDTPSKQNSLDKLCKLLCMEEDESIEERRAKSDYKQRRENAMPFKFFCQDCSFKTKREAHFKKHLELHEKVKKVLSCDQCDFKTIRESVLNMHKLNHGPAKFLCDHCSFKTNKLARLKYHLYNEHGLPYKTDKLVKCNVCDFTASSKQEIRKHKYLNHLSNQKGQLIWKCSKCPYQSVIKRHVKRHENDRHGDDYRPFLCHYCGMRFKRDYTLTQHKITHGEVKRKFVCELCGKAFCRLVSYKEHMTTHSDKRPFLCDVCGMSFKSLASTKRHKITVHLTTEVFPCPYCDKKYKTKGGRNKHKKSHRIGRTEEKDDPEVECVEETVQDQETYFHQDDPSNIQIVYTGTVLSDEEIVI